MLFCGKTRLAKFSSEEHAAAIYWVRNLSTGIKYLRNVGLCQTSRCYKTGYSSQPMMPCTRRLPPRLNQILPVSRRRTLRLPPITAHVFPYLKKTGFRSPTLFLDRLTPWRWGRQVVTKRRFRTPSRLVIAQKTEESEQVPSNNETTVAIKLVGAVHYPKRLSQFHNQHSVAKGCNVTCVRACPRRGWRHVLTPRKR
jgi:hypothetical protein